MVEEDLGVHLAYQGLLSALIVRMTSPEFCLPAHLQQTLVCHTAGLVLL